MDFILHGTIAGLSPLAVMVILFVIGLVIGFLVSKFLIIAVIVIIVLAVVIYLGLYSINIPALEQYGSFVVHYGLLLISVLPLGLGFIIGMIIGFIV